MNGRWVVTLGSAMGPQISRKPRGHPTQTRTVTAPPPTREVTVSLCPRWAAADAREPSGPWGVLTGGPRGHSLLSGRYLSRPRCHSQECVRGRDSELGAAGAVLTRSRKTVGGEEGGPNAGGTAPGLGAGWRLLIPAGPPRAPESDHAPKAQRELTGRQQRGEGVAFAETRRPSGEPGAPLGRALRRAGRRPPCTEATVSPGGTSGSTGGRRLGVRSGLAW